jgi:peroxiredoxin/DsbC/DsbD-like thiol-disulfide interchange protein
MTNIHRSFGAALVSCAIAVLIGTTARATDESPWNEDVRSAVRLIAGSSKVDDAVLRAGIEVKLRPGWKTYWRYPGDSGVPPHFDFSGSENLKKADVFYPAPHLFTDETGQSLGYKDTVIFPVVVLPQQSGKPVRLRVKVDYAVCEKLCVPVEGRAELVLESGDSKHDPTLTAAEGRVPKHVTAGQLGLTAKRANDGAKPTVTVDLGAPAGKPVEPQGRNYPTRNQNFLQRERIPMPIKVGDRLPDTKFRVMTTEGPVWKTTDEVFKGRKVALFAVPGAFTPTCNNLHIPSFLNNAAAIKAKGVHTIAVTGVNDVFVMEAWKKSTGAEGKIDFLADGNGDFAKAIDMAFDGSGNGLGTRSKRYSMLVDDGVVKKLNIEDAPGKCEISGGQTLLGQL